jgi:hypothetical protein
MKKRFPTLQRATWRSRFVAIARQVEVAVPNTAVRLPSASRLASGRTLRVRPN